MPQKTVFRKPYTPRYPQKYGGHGPIILKSSWEEQFAMKDCDFNSNCIQWAYEPCRIPYTNPLTGKQTHYVPDFLVTYLTTTRKVQTAMIEIKPKRESDARYAHTRGDANIQLKNRAKEMAAMAYCAARGYRYVIITEAELFGSNRKPPKKAVKPLKPMKRRR